MLLLIVTLKKVVSAVFMCDWDSLGFASDCDVLESTMMAYGQ